MPPLAFTDDELATIQTFAAPLHPHDRSIFLKRLAARLDGQELGDGLIVRTCAEVQQSLRRTPALDGRHHVGKWAR